MSNLKVQLMFKGGTDEEREEITDAFALLLIELGYNISGMVIDGGEGKSQG